VTKATKAKAKSDAHARSTATHEVPSDKATEHYHREKARRERRVAPEIDLMAAARREYLALLASEAAKGNGGRPCMKAATTDAADDVNAKDPLD
jgi:myo-inositol catabolism protein IolC